MKYFALVICLLLMNRLQAQQPKAYEMVVYRAQTEKCVFDLNYADGYLAASSITIKYTSKPAIVLYASGKTNKNGTLKFKSPKAINTQEINLQNVDETSVAPYRIIGTYLAEKRKISLQFKKSQR